MSLLDRGCTETVTVYREVVVDDPYGNTVMTKPSTTGIRALARIQVQNQSGTSSRRAEQDNEGFESEKVYSIRFTRSFDSRYGELGAQSQIEWRGKRWVLFGDVSRFTSSPRTTHNVYGMKRY